MDDLIERLEKATEGSYVLDCAIQELIYGPREDGGWPGTPKPYTVSLDAALSLVPNDLCWILEHRRTDNFVMAWVREDANRGPDRIGAQGLFRSYTSTPALGLCIAAFKAQAAYVPLPA